MEHTQSRDGLSTDFAKHWPLDPRVTHLNHGSFGACPRPVLAAQAKLREALERDPVLFFVTDLEELLAFAREELASFVGADPDDLVFVPNATAGVNTVLHSLSFRHGDELLATNHEYRACRNAIEFAAKRAGAKVVVAQIPFPIDSPDRVIDSVMRCVTRRTRLALLDHVTSQTALILPIAGLVEQLSRHGVDVLVDGAHAPGMLPVNVQQIGAAYYAANCHKWICAPKGAAFLHVRRDKQSGIRPLSISLHADSARTDRSRFQLEFEWTGTCDPTAALCVPAAIRFMGSLLAGGWDELMGHNRAVVLAGRQVLCDALDLELPCPDDMTGSMAALPLPDGFPPPPDDAYPIDPLEAELRGRFGIAVPIIPWPAPPKRLVRVSAQLYNSPPDYHRLAGALTDAL